MYVYNVVCVKCSCVFFFFLFLFFACFSPLCAKPKSMYASCVASLLSSLLIYFHCGMESIWLMWIFWIYDMFRYVSLVQSIIFRSVNNHKSEGSGFGCALNAAKTFFFSSSKWICISPMDTENSININKNVAQWNGCQAVVMVIEIDN